MAIGTLKWFHTIIGCGVIAPDDGTPGVLVRLAAGESVPLKKGDRLEYDTVRGTNGRNVAVNLRPVAEAAVPQPRQARS